MQRKCRQQKKPLTEEEEEEELEERVNSMPRGRELNQSDWEQRKVLHETMLLTLLREELRLIPLLLLTLLLSARGKTGCVHKETRSQPQELTMSTSNKHVHVRMYVCSHACVCVSAVSYTHLRAHET